MTCFSPTNCINHFSLLSFAFSCTFIWDHHLCPVAALGIPYRSTYNIYFIVITICEIYASELYLHALK